MSKKKRLPPADCQCGGRPTLCPACLIRFAILYRRRYSQNLSVAMVRRRVPSLGPREAALLVEFSKRF